MEAEYSITLSVLCKSKTTVWSRKKTKPQIFLFSLFPSEASFFWLTNKKKPFHKLDKAPILLTVSQCVSPLSLLHASAHQAGEDSHHHLGVDLHQVLGQGVDFGSDFPGHGDGVPVVGQSHTVTVTTFSFGLWKSYCMWRAEGESTSFIQPCPLHLLPPDQSTSCSRLLHSKSRFGFPSLVWSSIPDLDNTHIHTRCLDRNRWVIT